MTTADHPTYVVHDEVRWMVMGFDLGMEKTEGGNWYALRRWKPATRSFQTLSARVEDCAAYIRPRLRTIRGKSTDPIRLHISGEREIFNTTLGSIFQLLMMARTRREQDERSRAKFQRKRKTT